MSQKRQFFQKIGVALLGLGIILTASASPTLSGSTNTEKLHIPLILPGLTSEIRSLRFYGSDHYGSMEYHKRKSKYDKSFSAAKNKFINWELVLDHPIAREETVKFLITATLSDSSGQLVNKSETIAWVETDMPWSQWGGTFDVSAWKPGTYQVVITIGDRTSSKEYVRTNFHVLGEGDDFRSLQARIAPLRFYEDDVKNEATRVYSQNFPQSKTRYIYWELNLDYSPPNKLVEFTADAIWYGPEGNIIKNFTSKRTIQPDWKGSIHTGGLGWATPGQWRPGSYRLVLKINGNEAAHGSFQVVADKTEEGRPPGRNLITDLGAKITAVKFFEGPDKVIPYLPKEFRQTFARSSARFIYVQVDFETRHLGDPPISRMVDILWLDSQGRTFKEMKFELLEIGWLKPPFIKGCGWNTPGKWPPDTYQVVIQFLGQEVGRGSFRID